MSEPWFIPPKTTAEKLADAQAAKIAEINASYSEQAQPLIEDYPEIEQKGWTEQNREARAYLAWYEGQQGDPPATTVLDNILLGRNGADGEETLQELCVAVIGNADMFTQFQQLTGQRQRLVKLVRAAETEQEVNAISW
ncbi:hypothetical protein J7J47_11860 [Halomonas sp. ISL-60]|uniref:hypothetical protein n=1 Tax=Halomonas sp. ISL-56 TaxID=2819149 RepID=UPI001BEBD01C|nr:hypothetical protein [Halomonas sp. ISL-56]MBT2772918.1 hypothetical protein [Halomonas sp. ISL-60]MBT2799965.1 hypothetical protein [Halomonas sp. ISL-56]